MGTLLGTYWLIIAAIWYTGNGILHDVFVLMKHKGGYDRELLRLLMDGHVLILSGIVMFFCYAAAQKGLSYGAAIAAVTAAGMLVSCMMIYPFLKSFGTMLISIMALAASVRLLIQTQ
jgi:hypothetical protein